MLHNPFPGWRPCNVHKAEYHTWIGCPYCAALDLGNYIDHCPCDPEGQHDWNRKGGRPGSKYQWGACQACGTFMFSSEVAVLSGVTKSP